MTNHKIQFVGSPCGHHGTYTFYKGFKYAMNGQQKILTLGEFFFVKIWEDEDIIAAAETQLLWEDRSSGQILVSLRIYFLPENTPDGRCEEHGEHEVMSLSEKVVLKAEDVISWICAANDVKWDVGLLGVYAPPSPEGQHNSHYEPPIQSSLDMTEVMKEKSLLGDSLESGSRQCMVLNYDKYCRMRALLKRCEGVEKEQMRSRLIVGLGGFLVSSRNTRILFCRDVFEYPELEGHDLLCNHLSPKLQGRPRKKRKKRTDSESESSETSEDVRSFPPIKKKLIHTGSIRHNGLRVLDRNTLNKPPYRKPLVEDTRTNQFAAAAAAATQQGKVSFDQTPAFNRLIEVDFMAKLHKFMRDRNTPITRLPHGLNVFELFTKVQQQGGYEVVCDKKLWRGLYDDMIGPPPKQDNAQQPQPYANVLRRHYERLLLPYEKFLLQEQKKLFNMSKNSSGTNKLKQEPGEPSVSILQLGSGEGGSGGHHGSGSNNNMAAQPHMAQHGGGAGGQGPQHLPPHFAGGIGAPPLPRGHSTSSPRAPGSPQPNSSSAATPTPTPTSTQLTVPKVTMPSKPSNQQQQHQQHSQQQSQQASQQNNLASIGSQQDKSSTHGNSQAATPGKDGKDGPIPADLAKRPEITITPIPRATLSGLAGVPGGLASAASAMSALAGLQGALPSLKGLQLADLITMESLKNIGGIGGVSSALQDLAKIAERYDSYKGIGEPAAKKIKTDDGLRLNGAAQRDRHNSRGNYHDSHRTSLPAVPGLVSADLLRSMNILDTSAKLLLPAHQSNKTTISALAALLPQTSIFPAPAPAAHQHHINKAPRNEHTRAEPPRVFQSPSVYSQSKHMYGKPNDQDYSRLNNTLNMRNPNKETKSSSPEIEILDLSRPSGNRNNTPTKKNERPEIELLDLSTRRDITVSAVPKPSSNHRNSALSGRIPPPHVSIKSSESNMRGTQSKNNSNHSNAMAMSQAASTAAALAAAAGYNPSLASLGIPPNLLPYLSQMSMSKSSQQQASAAAAAAAQAQMFPIMDHAMLAQYYQMAAASMLQQPTSSSSSSSSSSLNNSLNSQAAALAQLQQLQLAASGGLGLAGLNPEMLANLGMYKNFLPQAAAAASINLPAPHFLSGLMSPGGAQHPPTSK